MAEFVTLTTTYKKARHVRKDSVIGYDILTPVPDGPQAKTALYLASGHTLNVREDADAIAKLFPGFTKFTTPYGRPRYFRRDAIIAYDCETPDPDGPPANAVIYTVGGNGFHVAECCDEVGRILKESS